MVDQRILQSHWLAALSELAYPKRKSQNLPFLDECLNVYANATTVNSRFILLNKESCNLIGSQPCSYTCISREGVSEFPVLRSSCIRKKSKYSDN